MPSEKQDNVKEFKKTKEDHKKKKNITWFLGALFLILTVAVFVLSPLAGVFSPSSSSLVFGEYDGTPIEYAYGNYFYEQQQNIAASWDGDLSSDTYQWEIYQIWKQAFDNTVINTAIMNQVEQSGLFVTDSAIDSYLLTQGPYIDENGNFSAEAYNGTSDSQKQVIRDSVKDSIAYQTVVNDMFSSIYSEKEIEYIKSLAAEEKAFKYVVFPLSDYPEERVLSYAQANLMNFTELDISLITLSADDEAAANSIHADIKSGAVLFEDAAKNNSTDSYAENGGDAGWFSFNDLAQFFENEDAVHAIFSLEAGEVSDLYETAYGYSIIRVNDGPRMPDLTDPDKIDSIRSYMISYETELVTNYMTQQAEAFAAQAADDFDAAAATSSLDIHESSSTPLNFNSSTFLKSFAYTDADQYLASIGSDEAALKALYSTDPQQVSPIISLGDGLLVAYCTEVVDATDSMDTLSLYYPYMVQQILQQEYTDQVFASDKLTDNFMQIFFAEVLQNS